MYHQSLCNIFISPIGQMGGIGQKVGHSGQNGRLSPIVFLSLAHEVGAGDIVITMSGRAALRPCFVFKRYLRNR